jgi:hypothetical protein
MPLGIDIKSRNLNLIPVISSIERTSISLDEIRSFARQNRSQSTEDPDRLAAASFNRCLAFCDIVPAWRLREKLADPRGLVPFFIAAYDRADSIDDRDFRVDEIRQIKARILRQDNARMDYWSNTIDQFGVAVWESKTLAVNASCGHPALSWRVFDPNFTSNGSDAPQAPLNLSFNPATLGARSWHLRFARDFRRSAVSQQTTFRANTVSHLDCLLYGVVKGQLI